MNAEVVTVCSRTPDPVREWYYRPDRFFESLLRFGETPTVLGAREPWRGLMTKPNLLRDWLRRGDNRSDRLIFCDAFDMVFTKHPHWVGDRCAERWGDTLLFNAERNCWPLQDLADQYPETGTPWRYMNGGFICGPADRMLAMLEAFDLESIGFDPPSGGPYPNDQECYQLAFVNQVVPMALDSHCTLVQCLSGSKLEEFDFTGEHVRNVLTGTEPGVWHLNGGCKEDFMPALGRHYGFKP